MLVMYGGREGPPATIASSKAAGEVRKHTKSVVAVKAGLL